MAFSSVDTLLSPFIKKDNLTYDEVKQSLQNFIFSINSNSRGGAEPAFSNITLDLTPPKDLLNENVMIGGALDNFTYKDCQKEMDMFNKAFCELMIKGDDEGKPFAYPIPTYNIHERFDWENPNNELLWEMAGKYGYPYFANFINSDMKPEDARSMCPLDGNTEILVKSNQNILKTKIKHVYKYQKDHFKDYQVWTNDGWRDCKFNRSERQDIFEILLSNGDKILMGEYHLQPTMCNGIKSAKDLTTEDWLPFNKKEIETDNLGTYELGFVVGAYAGDGSHSEDSLIYSLDTAKKDDETEDKLVSYWKNLGYKTSVSRNEERHVRSVKVLGHPYPIISMYINGDNALNKKLTSHFWSTSIDFKKGFIEGYHLTDGSRDRKRLYTSSPEMRGDLLTTFAFLGDKALSHYTDTREGRLGNNPNYRIDYPIRNSYGDYYKTDNNYNYYKIKSIKKIHNNWDSLYCCEVDNSDHLFMLGNGLITHNCRLRLNLKELSRRNGGLFGSGDSTGSIGVATINLPHIAYTTKGNKGEFFKELNRVLEIAKESLEIKREFLQKNVIETNLVPAFNTYVGTLRNHFSTIGIVSMNEMCENFFGEGIDILTEEGKAFSIEVSNFIREKLLKFQEETGNLYNYEATPAESTCYRLALKDKKNYPDIITRGTDDAPYYTNSCHIPVNKIKSIHETFEHQEDLQILFTGGTVIHIYMNGAISGGAAKDIVKTVCNKYKVPYVSISPLNRYCPEHGYVPERVDNCPKCQASLKKYQRITGYLRCVDNFNDGKKAEFSERNQL